jgi:cbb3-type cytochrome oxidase cytochrome c subunit
MNTSKLNIRFYFILTTFFTAVFLISGCASYDGEKLFFTEGCSQCHSIRGEGGSLAPDLSAVSNLRSDSWINNYMQNPKELNPSARMPSFKHLSGAKRKAIIAYLKK